MVKLQIFDVEHGACALLTDDNGARMMIDCGHNATTGWKPGTYLKQQNVSSIEMLAITNYDEDHVSGANDLFDIINVQWLFRNTSVTSSTIKRLKSEDGMGAGIERLVKTIDTTFSGGGTLLGQPAWPQFTGMKYQLFNNDYPTFDDENNLSMIVFLKCHGIGVMFTGDLERAGCKELLKNDAFRKALSETNVFVAPHHGREPACCEEAIQYLSNVYYVVISDKGYQYDTQKTIPFYRRIAKKGGPFRNEKIRHVLTTRSDGEITFDFHQGSWGPTRLEVTKPQRVWI